MEITYTEEKHFTQGQVEELFLSVGWMSGRYPERLYRALMHSSTVVTAWDGARLVGLARVLDDSVLIAYMHYVLVHPDYHGRGIATAMVERVVEKYRNFLYLEIMPEKRENAGFYQRFGFQVMEQGAPMKLSFFKDQP